MYTINFAPTKPILTPCIGVCTMGPDELCEGCFRTRNEIAAWSTLSDRERQHLMDQVLPHREQTR